MDGSKTEALAYIFLLLGIYIYICIYISIPGGYTGKKTSLKIAGFYYPQAAYLNAGQNIVALLFNGPKL